MTGSLQIKNDKYYAVLSWYEGEKRKQKWIATGFDVKGNKRRAEAFLKREMDKLEKLQDRHLTGTDQPFLLFMEQWLKERRHTSALLGIGLSLLCLLVFGSGSFIIPAMLAILAALTGLRGRLEEGRA